MTAASPEAPGSPLISFEHVHLAYPGADAEALSDLTLQVPAGQHVCILGGNGSGKSTLLQLVNVLVVPDCGTVLVCGMNTSRPELALSIRSRTASVFQHPEDQMVTSVVADDVAFGPENLCVERPRIVQRVQAALSAVDMESHGLSDPSDLSGGQMQRVAIAGALAMEPDILLLDEPCAMLDAEGRESVRHIIADLHERGITILHVTHFMEDAQAADRVIVLDHGRIAFDGTPTDLFSQPSIVRSLGLEMPPERSSARRGTGARHISNGANDHSGDRLPAGDPEPIVVFERVSFSYKNTVNPRKRPRARRLFGRPAHAAEPIGPLALDSLSFEVLPGTLTALIGRTGSGKSTTAELACALKIPTSGTVRVAGIDTTDLERRRELRRMVGYVAQLPERQLFAETVFDDVAFGPRNLGMNPQDIDALVRKALRSVNLDPTDSLLASSPFALSGGQQRGVALAGVLAMNQPVLVLDEPMAGLDPAGRARIRTLLRELRRAGTALIMVTHSMDDVAELADQIIALDQGRRVDADVTASAFFRPEEVSTHGAAR